LGSGSKIIVILLIISWWNFYFYFFNMSKLLILSFLILGIGFYPSCKMFLTAVLCKCERALWASRGFGVGQSFLNVVHRKSVEIPNSRVKMRLSVLLMSASTFLFLHWTIWIKWSPLNSMLNFTKIEWLRGSYESLWRYCKNKLFLCAGTFPSRVTQNKWLSMHILSRNSLSSFSWACKT